MSDLCVHGVRMCNYCRQCDKGDDEKQFTRSEVEALLEDIVKAQVWAGDIGDLVISVQDVESIFKAKLDSKLNIDKEGK